MADAKQQAPEKQENTGGQAPETKAATNEQPAATAAQPVDNQQEFTGITPAGQAPGTPALDGPAATAPAAPQTAAPEQKHPKPPSAEEETPAYRAPVQEEEEPKARSKFLPQGDHAKLLEAWKLSTMPESMEESLKGGSIKQVLGGFEFKLEDGTKFSWTIDDDGKEFIGTVGIFARMTPELAAAQIAAAKAHGWEEINIHGSYGRKEMLWLAAMREGLTVKNFMPDADSEVLRKWEKEKATLTVDVTQANAPAAPEAKAEAKAEAPKVETPAAEAPAAEAAKPATPEAAAPTVETKPETPAAEAPAVETPAAETAKPAEQKAEAPKAETPATETAAPAASKFAPVVVDAPAAVEAAAEAPKAEAPKAETPKAEGPKTEQPKAETPKAEEPKPEAPKADAPKNDTAKDPAHRAGIEKLQDAIKSGKVKVEGPVEQEIVKGIESPKGFNKAIEYFTNKSGADLGIPKVDVPAANADNNGPRQQAPKAKGAKP